MNGIIVFVAAVLSAIPLKILARVLGDENAKREGGKSIITMFICYTIAFSFLFFYAAPQKVAISPLLALPAWLTVLFGVIFFTYGLGFRKTLLIAAAMTAVTSFIKIGVW